VGAPSSKEIIAEKKGSPEEGSDTYLGNQGEKGGGNHLGYCKSAGNGCRSERNAAALRETSELIRMAGGS